jgi:hypothetical protein
LLLRKADYVDEVCTLAGDYTKPVGAATMLDGALPNRRFVALGNVRVGTFKAKR